MFHEHFPIFLRRSTVISHYFSVRMYFWCCCCFVPLIVKIIRKQHTWSNKRNCVLICFFPLLLTFLSFPVSHATCFMRLCVFHRSLTEVMIFKFTSFNAIPLSRLQTKILHNNFYNKVIFWPVIYCSEQINVAAIILNSDSDSNSWGQKKTSKSFQFKFA